MGARIFRDWSDSLAIHNAGDQAENLFTRLIMKADDYGVYHASAPFIRKTCYPLRDDLRDADILKRLASCQQQGLLFVFEVNQTGVSRWLDVKELAGVAAEGHQRFLVIRKFRQRLRQMTRKHPPPPPDDGRLSDHCQTAVGPPTASEKGSEENSVRDMEEAPDQADTIAKLSGIGVNMNPDIRARIKALIPRKNGSLRHQTRIVSAIERGIAKCGPGKRAIGYAASILEGEDEDIGGRAIVEKPSEPRPRTVKYAS